MHKNIPSEKVIIRSAKITDIPAIVELNKAWQYNALKGKTQNGFLTGTYPKPYLAQIIRLGDIVVATTNSTLAGYDLIANDPLYSPASHAAFIELRDAGYFADSERVGLGAQALVTLIWQGKRLRQHMLHKIAPQLRTRYEFLLSPADKRNMRAIRAHQKDGYVIAGQNQTHLYLVLNLNQVYVPNEVTS